MIKKCIVIGALAAMSVTAHADVGVMVGIGYTFGGGGPAITLKALSSDSKDEAVVAAGASFYPLSANKFGLDLGVGYHFDDAAVTLGWDFLQNGVQGGIGWANTQNDNPAPVAAPVVPGPL